MNFFDDVIKDIGKDTAKLSKNLEESHTFLDTGSYIFNALCSTSVSYAHLTLPTSDLV